MLATLRDAGVNLLAFSGFPSGRKAQIDFVPENAETFRAAAKAAKWKLVGPKKVFPCGPRMMMRQSFATCAISLPRPETTPST